MKTNPYVAIHCPKALSLSIVCQPIKIKFIKGGLSILHLKFSAFTTYVFGFESATSILSSGKFNAIIKMLRIFRQTKNFQSMAI